MFDAPERNIEAYKMIYEIESRLKLKVSTLKPHIKNVDLNLTELIQLTIQYGSSIDTPLTIEKFYNLIQIRNKVCHMKSISNDEMKDVRYCYKHLLDIQQKKKERRKERKNNHFFVSSTLDPL
ncbi:hypothetical protein [Bacillus sp. FJAT-45037]|uniref:hypothetical protein n=1 Tax=Bacillus sp. FJAT-45037 TaxID=2011007 RepID=UPI000C2327B4|nr:hypothetical protein [Bacillus sp. FJAT-45037]